MFLGCDDSDGLKGFYYSHDGYWSGDGSTFEGLKTKIECANTCMKDCFAFSTFATTSTGTCYHQSNRADLFADKISHSTAKSYIKCSDGNESTVSNSLFL